jgi:hypothetical protein
MRKVILLLAVAGLLVGLVGPASAAVFNADVDLVLVENGRVVDVSGTIVCTQGQEYFIRVSVRDSSGNEAFGRASGTCTGDPQQWWTGVVESDTGFSCDELVAANGRARAGGDDLRFSERLSTSCGMNGPV